MNGLHRNEIRLNFGECLAKGDTGAVASKRCGIAVSTPFRWLHRFLAGISTTVGKLRGIFEADETFFLDNRKGDRVWTCAREGKPSADMPDRRARKHDGEAIKRGLSDEQVLVLIAADCSGTTVSAVLPAVNAEGVIPIWTPFFSLAHSVPYRNFCHG